MKLAVINDNKQKEGNTRLISVKPFHWTCINGANGVVVPLVLTIIIKQTVMPHNISSDKKRDDGLSIVFSVSSFSIYENAKG